MGSWYSFFKKAQVGGEFWITDTGDIVGADGDVGEYNHEGYVMGTILSQYGLDYENNGIDVNDPSFIENYVRNNFAEVTEWLSTNEQLTPEETQLVSDGGDLSEIDPEYLYQLGVNNMTQSDIFVIMGMSPEEAQIANGEGDARLYAMKEWGWKRLEGRNIETWSIAKSDLSTITDGLWNAYDTSAEQANYNLYLHSTKNWYQDVPYSLLDSGNLGALRDMMFVGW